MSIRVLLVDDHELTRMGFTMMLTPQPDISIVAEAANGAEALAMTAQHHPDVILMDIRMPGLDGIEATRAITAVHPKSRVLILTTFDLDEYAFDGLEAGASGFLLKDVTPAQLVSAIHAVHDGDAVVTPRITRRMLELAPPAAAQTTTVDHPDKTRVEGLTEREIEILTAIAEGLTNGEIADRYTLAATTVKTYVGRLLAKLDARDRVELVILAYNSGITTSR